MIDRFELSEISFLLKHAYAMTYFDKRGEIVKKLKTKFPFVNTSTDKDKRIIMSTHDEITEDTAQGFFSPTRMGARNIGKKDVRDFYPLACFWSSTLIDIFGLDGLIDGAVFDISFNIDLNDIEDMYKLYEKLGFPLASNERVTLELQIHKTYEKDQKFYTLSINESDDDEGIFEVSLTYIYKDLENLKASSFNEELFSTIYNDLFHEFEDLFSEVEEVELSGRSTEVRQ